MFSLFKAWLEEAMKGGEEDGLFSEDGNENEADQHQSEDHEGRHEVMRRQERVREEVIRRSEQTIFLPPIKDITTRH